MKQYLNLLQKILTEGENSDDRTGVGTCRIFGEQLRFDLRTGFPAVTTKKLAWKAVVSELLWFMEGSSDERRLAEILHGSRDPQYNTIWTDNSEAEYWKNRASYPGDLGRVYGVQWRTWRVPGTKWKHSDEPSEIHVDQLTDLIDGLKKNPAGRRHVITAWNPGELDKMALPPCHMLAQFYVNKNNELSCQMYQRSVDTFLGLPFNIASYALMTHMIAQVCGMKVGELILCLGDTHIYNNSREQVLEQISRTPGTLPTLWLNPDITDIGKFTMADIKLVGYESQGKLTAPMAV